MPGLYSHTTRANGLTLTAAIYNADHENHITNAVPAMHDDYSTNVAEMQTTTDPGEVATESLATTLAGEIERLRFAILEIKQALDASITQWYQSPITADTTGRPHLPAWYIDGLELTVAVSSPKVVQVATGWCRSADDKTNIKVSTPLKRGLTALWASAVASGGGLCGAAVSSKSVYHVFAFKTLVSSYDIGGDSALNAANLMARASLVASDQHYRRIGSILVGKVSGTAYEVTQQGREIVFTNMDYADLDNICWVSQNDGTATLAFVELKTATGISLVPTGITVKAHLIAFATGAEGGLFRVFDGNKYNVPNCPGIIMLGNEFTGISGIPHEPNVWTSPSGAVLIFRSLGAVDYVQIGVLGWTDLCRS